MAPTSKPPDSVAVCFWLSLLVHVTVPPMATCTSGGWNLKSEISTLAAIGCSPAGVDPPDGDAADDGDAGTDIAADVEPPALPAVVADEPEPFESLPQPTANTTSAGAINMVMRNLMERVGANASSG